MEDIDLLLNELDDMDYMFFNDNLEDATLFDMSEDDAANVSLEEGSNNEQIEDRELSKSPSFYANSISEARNRYASALESELENKHIHIYRPFEYDSTHGGFTRATGQKIMDAINKARGEGRISDYIYKQLMDKLEDACYFNK